MLGVPVKFCRMELLNKKQQSNLHTQGETEYQNWLFGCPAWGTEPNSTQQVWYAGIQDEYCLECFKRYSIYMKNEVFLPLSHLLLCTKTCRDE